MEEDRNGRGRKTRGNDESQIELEAIKRQQIIITSYPSLSITTDLSKEKGTRERERERGERMCTRGAFTYY